MSMTGVDAFDRTIQKTNEWLNDLVDELNLRDRRQAYRVMRASLQTLRDRLMADEAAHLGSQLPMLMRGFYYEGWKPSATPDKSIDKTAFLERIRQALAGGGTEVENPEDIARAVFKLLYHRAAEGEIEDVRQMLPPGIEDLWPRKMH